MKGSLCDWSRVPVHQLNRGGMDVTQVADGNVPLICFKVPEVCDGVLLPLKEKKLARRETVFTEYI